MIKEMGDEIWSPDEIPEGTVGEESLFSVKFRSWWTTGMKVSYPHLIILFESVTLFLWLKQVPLTRALSLSEKWINKSKLYGCHPWYKANHPVLWIWDHKLQLCRRNSLSPLTDFKSQFAVRFHFCQGRKSCHPAPTIYNQGIGCHKCWSTTGKKDCGISNLSTGT